MSDAKPPIPTLAEMRALYVIGIEHEYALVSMGVDPRVDRQLRDVANWRKRFRKWSEARTRMMSSRRTGRRASDG